MNGRTLMRCERKTATTSALLSGAGTSRPPGLLGSPSPLDHSSQGRTVLLFARACTSPPSSRLLPDCFPQFLLLFLSLLAVAEEIIPRLGRLSAQPALIVVSLPEPLEYVVVGACPHFSW